MLPCASHFTHISLHPLSYGAVGLIVGIFFSACFSIWIVAGVLCIGILGLLAYNCSPRWLIGIALLYIGGVWRYQSCVNNHHSFVHLLDAKPCSVRGTIVSIERQDSFRAKQRVTIQSHCFLLPNNIHHLEEKTIQIYIAQPTDAWVSDTIEIPNFLLKKNTNTSYDHYLMKENIAATVFLPSLTYELIHRPSFSLSRTLFYFKQNLLARCKKKLSSSTFSFFASVFLGNKTYEKKYLDESKDNCKAWGISHYLARSGLHMVIFIYICFVLLNLLPLSFLLKQLLLIGIGILYYVLSWPTISFIRAFISFLLFKLCTLLKIPSQLLHLLSLVTITVLLYNPMQLFFLDFQLSFGLTFALAWFNRVTAQKSQVIAKY